MQAIGYYYSALDIDLKCPEKRVDEDHLPLIMAQTEQWTQLVFFPFKDKKRGILLPKFDMTGKKFKLVTLWIITLLSCPKKPKCGIGAPMGVSNTTTTQTEGAQTTEGASATQTKGASTTQTEEASHKYYDLRPRKVTPSEVK